MTRILVVDDDNFFGQMLMEWLKEQGYAVNRVNTAEAALEMAAAATDERPEIFLVDERLGSGLSGVELIARLRGVAPTSDAILFTGSTDPEIARRAYLAGAWRYLRRPFDPDEMGYVLAALQEWRGAKTAQFERSWLRVLNRISERLQYAHTVGELGQLLVDGGIELGFDRARFYRVRTVDGTPTLFGMCQSGVNLVVDFDGVVYSVEKTIYHQKAFAERKPTFFRNRELGPSFLSTLPQADGLPNSLGEWVIIPLFSGDECIGSLSMDNCHTAKSIHPQQKELLRLFAGQAVSALERAVRNEEEQRERQIENLARQIINQMGNPAENDALDRLLSAIHENFLGKNRDDNFIVTLQDKETGWYRYRLHIENGIPFPPSWQAPTQGGLIEYVMLKKSPLFLLSDVAAFREANNIAKVGQHPARSWMGVPLCIGEDVIGAVVMENDYRDYAFTEQQFNSFKLLAGHLTSVIQAAWLNEQQRKINQLLATLETGSVRITQLAMESEEWLWHTTLTLCTAHYGAGFDRAMLFLVERNRAIGSLRLYGRMAIGHLTKKSAHQDWEKDVTDEMDWEKYLTKLETGSLVDTPLHGAVQGFLIEPEKTSPIFQQILNKPSVLKVSQKEATTQLPADFLQKFGMTDYVLVPVQAGNRLLGVVVLDNIWETDPHQYGALPYIDALTNQAALIYEILQSHREQKQLIAIQRDVLTHANIDLEQTLNKIRSTVLNALEADIVSIDVLEDGQELRYSASYSGHVDNENLPHRHEPSHQPGKLARHILQNDLVLIENMAEHDIPYEGERADAHPFIQEKNIQALVGVSLQGALLSKPQGILFVSSHTPRALKSNEFELVRAYAQLAGIAISNWRDAQGLRDTQESRDRELSRLGEVLTTALATQSDERQIARLLLEKIPDLLAPLPVTVGIVLKEWDRASPESEPVEMHNYYYSKDSRYDDKQMRADKDTGICARAMRERRIQNIKDAPKDPDYRPRDENTHSELDVPILVDGQVVGALNIESPQLDAFTKHHKDMGQRFANIAALAIGNVRRQRNLQTILNAASVVTEPSSLEDTLDTIASEVRDAVPNLSLMSIWYQDPETRTPRLGSYFGVSKVEMKRESPRTDGAVQKGLTLDKPYYQTNVPSDSLFQDRSFVHDEKIQSTAIFPLRVQGEAVGVMFFSYRTRHEFTKEEKRLYPILAEVVASSISDALQLHQIERERKRLRITQEVTEVITASASVDQVLSDVKQKLESLYPRCTVYLARYNQRTGRLNLPPECGVHTLSISNDSDCFICHLAGESLRTGKKTLRRQRHSKRKGTVRPLRLTTTISLGATLVTGGDRGNGRLLGVLLLESPHKDAFDVDDEEIIRNVARQTRIALERFEQEANERFQSDFILRTFDSIPVVHDNNRYTGRILRRIERLQRDQSLADSSRQTLNELLEQVREMAARNTAMNILRDNLIPIALGEKLPSWIEETLSERSVPIDLKLDLSPDITVQAYPKALRRAIYDLVRNAMEAMGLEAENQQLSVTLRLAPDPGQAEIRICNNGPTIPPKAQSKLFNNVYSSKGVERGIGLLFVRAAVERMGGEVWLDSSTVEGGTVFIVRLKVAGSEVDIKESDNENHN